MKKQNAILLIIILIGIGLIYIGLNQDNEEQKIIYKNDVLKELPTKYPHSIEVNGKLIIINGSIKNETN